MIIYRKQVLCGGAPLLPSCRLDVRDVTCRYVRGGRLEVRREVTQRRQGNLLNAAKVDQLNIASLKDPRSLKHVDELLNT